MRAAVLSVVCLGVLAACDQLNKPMAVPNGNINPPGATSSTSSGGSDAGSDALAPLPPPVPGQSPVVTPQPGDVQL